MWRLHSSSGTLCKGLCPLTKLCRQFTVLSLSSIQAHRLLFPQLVSAAVGFTSADFGHGCISLPTFLGFLSQLSRVGGPGSKRKQAGGWDKISPWI